MASKALISFVEAVEELDALRRADATPEGKPPLDPNTTRVVGRAGIVLLSSHFERYIYAANQEATEFINGSVIDPEKLPETIRLLHSRAGIDAMLATDWNKRAKQLGAFVESDGWLWGSQSSGTLLHAPLLSWMKAPVPRSLVRYYRYWGITDIFSAITRTVHTRGDLWLKIDELVRKRNNIAHGDLSAEASLSAISSYRDATLRFCKRADRTLARAVAKIADMTVPW